MPENLMFRNIFLDTAQMARIAMGMPEVDERRVGAMGPSQGGGLALVCGALEPRIKLISAIAPFLSDYQRSWEMSLSGGPSPEIKNYFKLYDPQHKDEKAVFYKLGYIDVQHFAARIRGETLITHGMVDDCCPPSTIYAIYNKIGAKKRIICYPDLAHEDYPGINDEVFNFMQGL